MTDRPPNIEPPIEQLIEMVRKHGYHVVPCEDVVTLESVQVIPLQDLYRMHDERGFQDYVIKRLLTGMAASMGKVTVLETGDDLALGGKRFRARAKFIAPGAGFADPYEADLMRQMRESGR